MTGAERPPGALRWRPLALLLTAVGASLLIGAVLLRSPAPVFLALPLLLAAPAAALGGPKGSVRVSLERRAEGEGGDVRLVGTVRPLDRADARDLEVTMPRPPGLAPAGVPTSSATRDEVRVECPWRAREPSIVVVPRPQVVWRDAAGLLERSATFSAPPLVVARYPPELLRIGAVRLRRTTLLPGENLSRRIGTTGEFHGLRNALPDDPAHRINWRASARAGHLVANEYDLERTGDVLLLLDARPTPFGPVVDERLLSVSRAAALGIAESFLREKTRVGLGVFSEFLSAVPLAGGRTQELRVRDQLLAARLGPPGVPAERAAVAVGRFFRPGVTTVLFSPLPDDSAGELTVHLRRRGFPVVVLSPSPVPIVSERLRPDDADDALTARIVRLVRRARIARSWRDAPTIDWEDYWSLAPFVDFLRRPVTRRLG